MSKKILFYFVSIKIIFLQKNSLLTLLRMKKKKFPVIYFSIDICFSAVAAYI